MRMEIVKSDGRIYHETTKNVTRPVLRPTEMKPNISRRFRGRITLRHNGETTWRNEQAEVGIQGFRIVRVVYLPDTETAEILSS